MSFGFLKKALAGTGFTSDKLSTQIDLDLKPVAIGVIDRDQPDVDLLFRAVATYLELYLVDDADQAARYVPYPGGVLPELMPGLFNALRFEIIPEQLAGLHHRDFHTITDALPDLMRNAGLILRDLCLAEGRGDTTARKRLAKVRGVINADCAFHRLSAQRFSLKELAVFADLLIADCEIRPLIAAMRKCLSPKIVDRHGELESVWHEQWSRAVTRLDRDLRRLDGEIRLGNLPPSTIALVFLTLTNRRIIRPGQLVTLLKTYLMQIDADLLEATEYHLLLDVLFAKLTDHSTKLSGLLANDLADGVRRDHLDLFSAHFDEFHGIYYGMVEHMALAGHPVHGEKLDHHRGKVQDAVLEKLMPAIGALVFDTFPDPHSEGAKAPLEMTKALPEVDHREKICKQADTDWRALVPFFALLRKAARQIGMDRPARDLEKGLVMGLNYRIKAFSTDLTNRLENEPTEDLMTVTATLSDLDQLFEALSQLGLETTSKNARHYLRNAVKASVRRALEGIVARKGCPEELEAHLNTQHGNLAYMTMRLMEEYQADLIRNGRFADPMLLEIAEALHGEFQVCYHALQHTLAVSMKSGDLARAEQLLKMCDRLASAFAHPEIYGRLAGISQKQPLLVRGMLYRAVESLLGELEGCHLSARDIKLKLLNAAEAVKRLHDYFAGKGDQSTADELLKKLQLALVMVQQSTAKA